MTFENKNNQEQIQIDPTIKQEQIDRDFEDVLKEFQDMSHQEQWDFLEAIANKDPHFNELYTQLKVFFQDKVLNPKNYVEIIQTDTIEENNSIELSNNETNDLVQKWNIEIQKITETNEKINKKLLSLNLILDISWMYKEYLQSILTNIKFKFVSNKDIRYEKQINEIETEIRNKNNLTEYLKLLWNTNDLLNLDIEDLLNRLIVSEEKISKTLWKFDQPISFLWNKENTIENVNAWYEDIRKTLSNPNIKNSDIQDIRMDIFNKIRSFDWLDDDKHRYNSSEWIRSKITTDVLNNTKLKQDSFIKNNFDLINNIWEKSINEFSDAFKWGKEKLNTFLEKIKLFDNLWISEIDNKEELSENIYDSLKKWEKNIDETKLGVIIKEEIDNKINYLDDKIKKSENKDKKLENKDDILVKINELKEGKSPENIKEHIKKIKKQTIFKTFERIIISETLEKKSEFVKKISTQDKEIDLYRDIEWIWKFNISDKRFNSISTWTQFLAEQIAIMAISGWVWGVALKWFWKLAQFWETTNLLKWWFNIANIWKLSTNTLIEWSAFYLAYTWLNWLVNEKEANQLFDKLDWYDAIRTILFLWVLRIISKSKDAFTVKNISLDTASILWTDLIIRASIWQLMWKEKIEWIDFKNLSNSNLKEFWSFITEELKFIIPLVIWLRISDMGVKKIFKDIKKPRIEIIPKEDLYILKIEWLKKDIRILKQNRNSFRNKWKNISEINTKLKKKKAEHKEAKDNKQEVEVEVAVEVENSQNKTILQKAEQNNTVKKEPKKSNPKEEHKKNKSEEGVNKDGWISPKYKDLDKYSKEAQLGKIDYALNDKIIWKTLVENWIWKKWDNVWKWLLEKSWFKKWEKIEPKTKFEKNAVREMKEANRVVYKDFMEAKNFLETNPTQKDIKNYMINIWIKDKEIFIKLIKILSNW